MTVNPKTRYTKSAFYRQVETESFFATAPSHKIGMAIETMVMDILKREKDFIEHVDVAPGGRSESNKIIVIYLVTAKTDNEKCPFCDTFAHGLVTKRIDKHT